MATSLLGGLIVGATQVVGNFQKDTSSALSRGQEEDIRTIFRNKVDCKETLDREKTACDAPNGFVISGYDANGNKLIDNPTEGIILGKSRVRLVCWKDADTGSYLMNARLWGINEAVSADTGKTLFNIPLACKGGCAPRSWGDPYTLSVSPGRHKAHRIVDLINSYAAACEQPRLPPGTGAIRRSVSGSGWEDREITSFDLSTLKQICNTIGYDNYVSSKCRDGGSSGVAENGEPGKCNYNNPTPDEDYIHRWNGTTYMPTHSGDPGWSRGSYKEQITWLSEITCSGKR